MKDFFRKVFIKKNYLGLKITAGIFSAVIVVAVALMVSGSMKDDDGSETTENVQQVENATQNTREKTTGIEEDTSENETYMTQEAVSEEENTTTASQSVTDVSKSEETTSHNVTENHTTASQSQNKTTVSTSKEQVSTEPKTTVQKTTEQKTTAQKTTAEQKTTTAKETTTEQETTTKPPRGVNGVIVEKLYLNLKSGLVSMPKTKAELVEFCGVGAASCGKSYDYMSQNIASYNLFNNEIKFYDGSGGSMVSDVKAIYGTPYYEYTDTEYDTKCIMYRYLNCTSDAAQVVYIRFEFWGSIGYRLGGVSIGSYADMDIN